MEVEEEEEEEESSPSLQISQRPRVSKMWQTWDFNPQCAHPLHITSLSKEKGAKDTLPLKRDPRSFDSVKTGIQGQQQSTRSAQTTSETGTLTTEKIPDLTGGQERKAKHSLSITTRMEHHNSRIEDNKRERKYPSNGRINFIFVIILKVERKAKHSISILPRQTTNLN